MLSFRLKRLPEKGIYMVLGKAATFIQVIQTQELSHQQKVTANLYTSVALRVIMNLRESSYLLLKL